MDKRFAIFLALAFLIIAANSARIAWLRGPAPADAKKDVAQAKVKPGNKKGAGENAKLPPGDPEKRDSEKPTDAKQPAQNEKPAPNANAGANNKDELQPPKKIEPAWIMLGSLDPESPYRMLVTLTNRGAAVQRLELSDPHYRDREDRSGYLGHLAETDATGSKGCLVRVVGPGTPAEKAGLKSDDVITSLNSEKITSAAGLDRALEQTKPNQQVELTVIRTGKPVKLNATLMQRPAEVVRPEKDTHPLDVIPEKAKNPHDPFSFLLTLEQIEEQVIEEGREELAGIDLREGTWEVASQTQEQVTFRRQLPKQKLELTKRFVLAKLPAQPGDADDPAYHLRLELEIKNTAEKGVQIAYRLDGPTGLPTEGWWYASRVSRNWSGGSLRDVVARFRGGSPNEISGISIADDKGESWSGVPLDYLAVDSQYFSVAMIPQMQQTDDSYFQLAKPIRVGAVPEDKALKKLTNVSFRMVSKPAELQPNESIRDNYVIYAGPKNPELLAAYTPPQPPGGRAVGTLEDLVYYGWFGFVARPMLWVLHSFYALVHNYGVAIIMLTVLVRGCMFPISRKQAINAQKMQLLMPEIKKLREKYKNDLQQFGRAQQELFRKHEYNQLSGCLPLFIQMPIFVGLYRSLMVDVELRAAPLFSAAIQWCSDLAAPDMFWDWSPYMPALITHGTGFFGLGPYLNILPLITIALFLWQQKLFMPPPADDQAKLQQQMMKYMMVFMGIMFYKVASGLCIYFIASSLWGIAERKLLPKATAAAPSTQPAVTTRTSSDGKNGSAARRKQRGRK